MPGRRLSMVAALICAASVAPAQRWEGGLKTGVSQAGLTPSDEFVWNKAPTTGMFAWRKFNRFVAIQPELIYVRRTGVSGVVGSTVTMTTDNVELPILVRFQLPQARDGGIAPYVSVGPNLGIRMRCRVQFLGGGVSTNDPCESGGAQSRQVDAGVAGGAGVDWYLGSVSVVTEARAAAGLRPYVLPTDASQAKSVSWSLLAGISMPLRFGDDPRPAPRPVSPPRVVATSNGTPADSRGPLAGEGTPVVPVIGGARRVTLTVDHADIHDVVLYVLKTTGYRIEVPTDVHERVSGTLSDITPEEAARAIASVAGLTLVLPTTPEQPARLVRMSVATPAAKPIKQ
ncbi:MAG TPA: porin family protein [Gemmatimonadaceae bacterium]|nr:porin family protein [Gemmatimonadaceae bacterium]